MTSIYSPLDSDNADVRLLKLEPAPPLECEAVCSLSTTSLSTKPAFDALSYCWGDATVTKPIVLNGVRWSVTVNLEAALRHLRHLDEAITLWVDAVCINQSDTSERSSQVKLMRSIYGSAKVVRIWLGEAADGSDELLRTIHSIVHGYPEAEHKSTFMHSFSLEGRCIVQDYVSQPIFELNCEKSFAKRAWWSRVWVIQEAVLAGEAVVHCGSQQILFQDFLRLHQITEDLESINFALHEGVRLTFATLVPKLILFYQTRTLLRRHQQYPGHPLLRPEETVLLTLTCGRMQKATDHRDKIYGMLGLLPDSRYQVHPNYDWSLEQVYTQYSLQLMTVSNSLSAFYFVSSTRSLIPELASWVPDWSSDD